MKLSYLVLILSVCFFIQFGWVYLEDSSSINSSARKHLIYEGDSIQSYLVYSGFITRYDEKLKIPLYTIHQVTPRQIKIVPALKAKRRSGFIKEKGLPRSLRVRHKDYNNLGFDRGHMTPAADFYSDKSQKDETFYLTNITPQTPDFNQGIWRDLECQIRNFIRNSGKPAILITGAIVDSKNSRGISPKRIAVPSHFYKVIIMSDPTQTKVYAFLYPHLFAYPNHNHLKYQVTLDSIENHSGHDFLDKLPDSLENAVESEVFPANWVSSQACVENPN